MLFCSFPFFTLTLFLFQHFHLFFAIRFSQFRRRRQWDFQWFYRLWVRTCTILNVLTFGKVCYFRWIELFVRKCVSLGHRLNFCILENRISLPFPPVPPSLALCLPHYLLLYLSIHQISQSLNILIFQSPPLPFFPFIFILSAFQHINCCLNS